MLGVVKCASLGAFIFACVPADAATIVQNFSVTTPGYSSQTFNLVKFDGALGTLNSVLIAFSGGTTNQFSFWNDTGSTVSTFAQTTSYLSYNYGAGILQAPSATPVRSNFTMGRYSTRDLTLDTVSSASTLLTDVSSFVGTGLISTQLRANRQYTSGAALFAIATGLDDSTVTVTYNYTAAVPEPATWAMFVGGFGLIGGSMRRRQRTAVRFV